MKNELNMGPGNHALSGDTVASQGGPRPLSSKDVSTQELIDFLDAWEQVGQLQTFQSREKFRKEARFFIQRLELARDSAHEPAAAPSQLVATLNEIAVRALAVGPKDHNITLDEIRAISSAAERLAQPPVPEQNTGRYRVERVTDHSADFRIWDGGIGAATDEDAAALQAQLNRSAPTRITDSQCEEIIAALGTYEWTGFSRDDIRLIAGTIATYSTATKAGE